MLGIAVCFPFAAAFAAANSRSLCRLERVFAALDWRFLRPIPYVHSFWRRLQRFIRQVVGKLGHDVLYNWSQDVPLSLLL